MHSVTVCLPPGRSWLLITELCHILNLSQRTLSSQRKLDPYYCSPVKICVILWLETNTVVLILPALFLHNLNTSGRYISQHQQRPVSHSLPPCLPLYVTNPRCSVTFW
uniref:Uncharacterized protein n=1 Tax=Uncultured archaeon GZfos26G2 TaxID=3386331 RepID=Q64AQ8_UNCAG|nr:hypothetical protein GZ30H9_6 [uncultured archaeon GZfos30H9]